MFQQFIRQCTQDVHKALDSAINELVSLQENVLTTDHLLLGLLSQKSSEAVQILTHLLSDRKTGIKTLSDAIYGGHGVEKLAQSGDHIVATAELEAVFRDALKVAKSMGDTFIGTGALLIALIEQQKSQTAIYLLDARLSTDQIREQLFRMRNGKTLDAMDDEGRKDALSEYTTDLTEMARNGLLDPVIGREEEISRVIQTLSRRKKNNPVLIGQPGVGKTVIVEGLAQRIANADIPETLLDRRILSLDMAEIVAGAKMRGEFEERLMSVRDAVIEAKGKIILFIDELHTVVGAGAGGLDAPAILKSALERGTLQVIAADTLAEYRRFVEPDKALERRFQPVMVNPPSIEDTIKILSGLAYAYEIHHDIHYHRSALEAAASLSDRYISDRQLPDKAVDLLDESGAQKHLRLLAMSEPMSQLERERQSLLSAKTRAFEQQAFEQVARHQMSILALEQRIEQERVAQRALGTVDDDMVTEDDVARVVARLTGIPVTRLTQSESDKLANIEDKLHQRIVGQDAAITAVANAIRRNRTGISKNKRPIASFLFLGPTGVGKTELAKALAEFLLDDETRIVRLDMSEYMERHEVSKMIGAPPGYLGYGEGGQLTEKVRRNPYTVVLLDEVEKAHPDVVNMLLQILEDGRLTDAQGQTVSFQNTLIIGTSNLGSDALISDRPPVGFIYSSTPDYEGARKSVLHEVKRYFKPEFLNRLDDVIVFHYLSKEQVKEITQKMVTRFLTDMKDSGLTVTIDVAVLDKISVDGFVPNYGARPLRREIETQIENPLAAMIVRKTCVVGDAIHLSLVEGVIQFDVLPPQPSKTAPA